MGAYGSPDLTQSNENSTKTKARFCPSCGKSVQKDFLYCPYCGGKFIKTYFIKLGLLIVSTPVILLIIALVFSFIKTFNEL